MPRPTTKNDLMAVARQNYEKLNLLISKMSEQELNTPFDFSKDEKKKRPIREEIKICKIPPVKRRYFTRTFKTS